MDFQTVHQNLKWVASLRALCSHTVKVPININEPAPRIRDQISHLGAGLGNPGYITKVEDLTFLRSLKSKAEQLFVFSLSLSYCALCSLTLSLCLSLSLLTCRLHQLTQYFSLPPSLSLSHSLFLSPSPSLSPLCISLHLSSLLCLSMSLAQGGWRP